MDDLLLRRRMISSKSLPGGYTRLNWVHFDGECWIETTYLPNSDTDSEFVIYPEMYDCSVYGNLNGERFTSYIGDVGVNGNQRFGIRTCTVSSVKFFTGDKVICKQNKTRFEIDGISYPYTSQSDFVATEQVSIGKFTNDNVNSKFVGKIYSFVIKELNVEVLKLIPARRNIDQEVGLYDLVTNTFYPNVGTGNITGG